MDYSGKVGLITGGTTGIGFATAKALLEAGAQLMIASRSADNGAEALKQLNSENVRFSECDVSDEQSVENLVKETVSAFGKLDFAFNNAGAEPTGKRWLEETSMRRWNNVVDVHLSGVFRCMKYEVEAMIANGGGCIVNMSSVYGLRGDKVAYPSYVASKHAVIGLTKSTAVQYAKKNIRVNAVCPGIILTPMLERTIEHDPSLQKFFENMHPMARVGAPHEVADGVMWLCSDKSSFVTGHALAIDGGIGAT